MHLNFLHDKKKSLKTLLVIFFIFFILFFQNCKNKVFIVSNLSSEAISQNITPTESPNSTPSLSQTLTPTPSLSNETWVFIFAGQSNMVGSGLFYPNWFKELSKLPDNLTYFLKNKKMTSFNEQNKNFGPEVSFLITLARENPNQKIIGIKYAVGGTSLAQWLPTYLNNEGQTITNTEPLYNNLISFIQEDVKTLETSQNLTYKALI